MPHPTNCAQLRSCRYEHDFTKAMTLGIRDCRGRTVGDRSLQAFKPPLLDSPATVGFYDDQSGACFSSDCFGAPVPNLTTAVGEM